MKAGVSSACLYPQLLEKSVEDIARFGIKNTEIFINTDSELRPSYVKELKKVLDFYGTSCASMHPFTCAIEPMMFFTNYPRRIKDILDYYKKFFEAMNILDAKIFVFHGNKSIIPVDESLYFERFLKLSETGRKFNITVAQENVERCQCNNIQFMKNMVAQLGDEAKFVIDIKQAVRSGSDIFEIVNCIGENIAHIHISDNDITHDCLPLGSGTFNIPLLIKSLKQKSFNGSIMIELYRANFFDIQQLKDNYMYLCNIIDNILCKE